MAQYSYGITVNDTAVPQWVHVLPRLEGELPGTAGGRQWRWLRLDGITQIMANLSGGGSADIPGRYTIVVTSGDVQYHPTAMVLNDEEATQAEQLLMEHVARALDVFAKGRKG